MDIREQTDKLHGTRYNWEGTVGCGLCQTAVPCEERVLVESRIQVGRRSWSFLSAEW